LNYDIYAQKINSTGNVIWKANGTEICTANETQAVPQICSDGEGGAIITWTDYRNQKDYNIYAQKINSTGNVIWNANGTEICTEGGDQIFPKICRDGAGGAIITWEDSRGIYAQRINSTGYVKWIGNGTAICTANNTQWKPQICSDGIGGAIITWEDLRNGIYRTYARRIDVYGNPLWTTDGVPLTKQKAEVEATNQEVEQAKLDLQEKAELQTTAIIPPNRSRKYSLNHCGLLPVLNSQKTSNPRSINITPRSMNFAVSLVCFRPNLT